jgi:dTDP-4-dehydrorhamnose reductase
MSPILVLGGEGMLGHKMLQTLRSRYSDVHCTILGTRDDAIHRNCDLFQQPGVIEGSDLRDYPAFERLLADLAPEVVVNCVGIVKQRAESKSPLPSLELNSLLPHRLAGSCARWGGRVIHFSTDCVFSGQRGGYTEEDPTDVSDLYGLSKYLGEVGGGNALTLRTSIIGRELFNFESLLEWFLSQNHGTVKGFRGAIYSGVTTNHMADLVGDVIERHPQLSGLYHVVAQAISKHDLLCQLRDAYGLDIEIVPDDTVQCDRSMKGDKLREAIAYEAPPWPLLVGQLAEDPTPYEKWRATA